MCQCALNFDSHHSSGSSVRVHIRADDIAAAEVLKVGPFAIGHLRYSGHLSQRRIDHLCRQMLEDIGAEDALEFPIDERHIPNAAPDESGAKLFRYRPLRDLIERVLRDIERRDIEARFEQLLGRPTSAAADIQDRLDASLLGLPDELPDGIEARAQLPTYLVGPIGRVLVTLR